MKIGVPKEIKASEHRVGLTPASVRDVVRSGASVIVEAGAGAGIGFGDELYRRAGAAIAPDAASVFAEADMIVKVKEPQPREIAMLRPRQVLFTYLHLAADLAQTKGLMQSGATCIAYETVTDERGALPLLAPMSEIAGRMSVQVAAHLLEKEQGGLGLLLGGVPGVPPARVTILGGGVSGTNAAHMAVGLGADVAIIDRSLRRLRELHDIFGARVRTLYATSEAIEQEVCAADVVIGAVLVPGAAAPKLVTRSMLAQMRPGAMLIDIAIDQGGCFETSHPTTHAAPTFVVEGITHYCVANMPGAVARTSTHALNNATLPFVVELAGKGADRFLEESPQFRNGLNIKDGRIVHSAVQSAFAAVA